MKNLKLGTGAIIFILFFGISVLEAFRTRNWMNAAFWVVIGILFLVADNLRGEKSTVD